MTKQGQIEEIEQFIYDYVDSKQTERVYLFGSCVDELAKPFVHNKGIAEALYNAGYRKLSDNVILLDNDCFTVIAVNKSIQEIKNEAVKEFAEKCMDGVGYGSDERIIKKYLDELIKEYEQ